MTLVGQLDGFDSEARPEDAIERGRCAAALQMSEHAAARFLARPHRQLLRHNLANPAKAIFPRSRLMQHLLTIPGLCAFRGDDERAQAPRHIPPFDEFRQLFVIEWDLRNQNRVGSARDPAVECDPAGMTTHHFEHHDAFVTRRRRMQAIQRIGHGRDRGIETEGHGRRLKIVVDCFRNPNAVDARFLQLQCGIHRTVAAHDDERFHLQTIQNLARLLDYLSPAQPRDCRCPPWR